MPTRPLRLTLLLTILALPVTAEEWPNWRGPRHDGVSEASGLKLRWESAPPTVWQRNIGAGFSGFALVDGKLYTAGTEGNQQVAYCLNADTGEVLWQTPIEAAYKEGQGGDGPRATPAVSDGRVYLLAARGRLVCLSAADGKLIWEHKFNGMPTWGYSGSVLIEGDKAIASAGGDAGALVAFDRVSGKRLWKCGDDPVGYATPYPFEMNGVRYVVGFMGNSALIARASDGKRVWHMPWETAYNVNASAPIFHDGHLLLSTGYRHGAVVVQLGPKGEELTHSVVWEGKSLRNKFQSCVLRSGHLYTSDEVALKCVEFLTGKEKWTEPRLKHGTVVLAQDHLIVLTENGELIITPATPEGFRPVTRLPVLEGRCWTVPTLYKGRLYARNLETLVCLKLAE